MVKRVAAPAEHYLITQGQNLVTQFGGETLSKFAVQKLLEHKMTSRNFKAGLDFTDSYKAQRAREKLGKMIVAHVEKQLEFLYKPGVTEQVFFSKTWQSYSQLVVRTFYDKAVERYCLRVNKALEASQIPIRILITSYNYDVDTMEIGIGPATNNRSTFNYYRLMFHLEQVTKFFKCLSKKAKFSNQDAKAINRSKLSGYFPTRDAERDARAERAVESAPGSPPNNRRTGAANRAGTAATAAGNTTRRGNPSTA